MFLISDMIQELKSMSGTVTSILDQKEGKREGEGILVMLQEATGAVTE